MATGKPVGSRTTASTKVEKKAPVAPTSSPTDAPALPSVRLVMDAGSNKPFIILNSRGLTVARYRTREEARLNLKRFM